MELNRRDLKLIDHCIKYRLSQKDSIERRSMDEAFKVEDFSQLYKLKENIEILLLKD